jgi:diguanylate cyclase (GGDEF)-like protein
LTGTGRYRRVESELDVPSAVVELLLAASGYGGRVDRVDRALVIGLSGAAEVTGALYLERSDLPPSATDLCAMYARLVGQAISSAVLFRQSTVDALTGLYSREFGLHRLEQTLALGSRHGQVTSILALDVDHFKRVNDTHGHAGGDVVLNALGRLLLDSLRAGDFAARLGGEELLVVLPHTEEAGAMIVGERLRRLVAAWRGQHNGEDLQVTVSIGAAEAEPGERLTQDLLSRADDALYAAKSGGRNRVVRAGG